MRVTGKVLGQVANHGGLEATAAIQAAHEAFQLWSKRTGKERGDVIVKIARLMHDSIDDLAAIITLG